MKVFAGQVEAEPGHSRNFQSLLSRLASDASALTNIVPLPIGRLRSDTGDAERPDPAELGEDGAAAAPSAVPDDTQELEKQLEEELKAQGQKKGFLDILRHWRSTAYKQAERPADQVSALADLVAIKHSHQPPGILTTALCLL